MPRPLRLGISGSSFIFVMPDELRVAAYVTPVKGVPAKLDERLNTMMLDFTREMMLAVNEVASGGTGCALECYYSSSWDTDAVVRTVLDNPGVELWSVHGPYGRHFDLSSDAESVRENGVAAYFETIEIAAEIGARLVVAHSGANENYGLPKSERLNLSIDPFRRIADYAGERGVVVALEPLPKSEVGSRLEDVIEIIEKVNRPNIGINFDVNHQFPPEAIPAMIRQAGARILSMHISDQDGIERHWLPFRGTLDWPEILKALVEIGYTGPLIYETHIHDVPTCDQVCEIIVENYNRLIQMVGRGDDGKAPCG